MCVHLDMSCVIPGVRQCPACVHMCALCVAGTHIPCLPAGSFAPSHPPAWSASGPVPSIDVWDHGVTPNFRDPDTGGREPSEPPTVAGKPQYLHMGEEVDGVDMRAEVGLLSRNIVVRGEVEPACYPYTPHVCNFFHFDTFGGHIKVGGRSGDPTSARFMPYLRSALSLPCTQLTPCPGPQVALGFAAVHLEGVELVHMGQQLVGQYPLHFHLAGDLDSKGGYDPPTYVRDMAIHHTFSRCVTVHGSNGLLVSDSSCN